MKYPHFISPKEVGSVSKNQLSKFLIDYRQDILLKIYDIGAILLRGFDLTSSDDFKDIVHLFSPTLKNYIGGDSPRHKVQGSIYTSTEYPPEATISMHHEKSYSNTYPNFIYFFCETPPISGGETPILDSRKIYNLLDQEIINKFARKKLKYVMNLHNGNGIGKSWQETFEVEEKNLLEEILNNSGIKYLWKTNGLLLIEETVSPVIHHPITGEPVFFSQADQWHPSNLGTEVLLALNQIIPQEDFYHNCYYGDGSEIEVKDLNIIRELVSRELTTFQWQKGDLLILDNIISMHGRLPFSGPRRILVAMS
jgi:hypothetical protein